MYFQNLRKQNYISSATKKKEDKLTKNMVCRKESISHIYARDKKCKMLFHNLNKFINFCTHL